MILIPTVATERASAKFVFTHFNTDNEGGIHSRAYIFILGLLMSQYTLTGYDASAHMSEETKNADVNGPKGIIAAIGISVIVGWAYLLGITFAVTNVPYLLSADNDAGGYAIAEVFYLAFKSRYGSGVGGIICLGIIVVAIFFCGMSSVTSNSRMAYAFSRDGAMPLSSLWHKVNKQDVPINAVWLSVFISFCMALPVQKRGSVGRTIDVARYRGYDDLRHDLACMFGIEGLLEVSYITDWKLVYVDHENDVLLVGEDP